MCGVLPFGRPVRSISTLGLRWDLGGEWGAVAMGTPDGSRQWMPPSSSNEAAGWVEGQGKGEGAPVTGEGGEDALRELRLETSDPVVLSVEHRERRRS